MYVTPGPYKLQLLMLEAGCAIVAVIAAPATRQEIDRDMMNLVYHTQNDAEETNYFSDSVPRKVSRLLRKKIAHGR